MSVDVSQAPEVVRASLKSRMISASVWVVTGSVAANVIRLLSNLVLTRLLFPEAFGLMMIATTVSVIVWMLSDVGIQQSIVRGPRSEDPVFLDTAWAVQIVRGAVIWFAACGIAFGLHMAVLWGWVSAHSTYSDPLLPWVIAVNSFTSVISGFNATDVASANRRLNLKPMVALDLTTQLFGTLLMIGLAWLLKSVWALVISSLASALLYAFLSHRVFRIHRNRMRLDRPALQELIAFGKWLALSSAVSVFVSNGDRLILGALVNPEILGLFAIAGALAGVLGGVIQSLFAQVMLPAFGEVVRDQPSRVAEAYFRLRWRIDPLILCASGALFALGPLIISVLYDTRYQAAGQMLQILSLGLIVGRFFMVQQVYLALNEPRYQVALNLLRLLLVAIAVPGAFQLYGFTGALVAIALRDLAVVPLLFWFNSKHGLNNFRLESLWLLFWPAGWCAGAATLAVHEWLVASI